MFRDFLFWSGVYCNARLPRIFLVGGRKGLEYLYIIILLQLPLAIMNAKNPDLNSPSLIVHYSKLHSVVNLLAWPRGTVPCS